MRQFFRHTILITTLIFSSFSVNATPATPESIRSLIELTGSSEIGVEMLKQTLPSLKVLLPNAPESFWVDVMSEVTLSRDKITNMLVPVYQRHLTEEDVIALTAFYQTETGQKMIQVLPAITQESMVISRQWGQNIAGKILDKYKATAQTTQQRPE